MCRAIPFCFFSLSSKPHHINHASFVLLLLARLLVCLFLFVFGMVLCVPLLVLVVLLLSLPHTTTAAGTAGAGASEEELRPSRLQRQALFSVVHESPACSQGAAHNAVEEPMMELVASCHAYADLCATAFSSLASLNKQLNAPQQGAFVVVRVCVCVCVGMCGYVCVCLMFTHSSLSFLPLPPSPASPSSSLPPPPSPASSSSKRSRLDPPAGICGCHVLKCTTCGPAVACRAAPRRDITNHPC